MPVHFPLKAGQVFNILSEDELIPVKIIGFEFQAIHIELKSGTQLWCNVWDLRHPLKAAI